MVWTNYSNSLDYTVRYVIDKNKIVKRHQNSALLLPALIFSEAVILSLQVNIQRPL